MIVYSVRARLVALALKNHGDGDFITLLLEKNMYYRLYSHLQVNISLASGKIILRL